ncbi:methionine--tRNA ligase [Striga asiatica]|uniref:Methionine--tRNA ligase n=1 Tax=Striga asiatica TaxID=4170 RepID=A0A5A7P5F9_STRAF|nr:methionine--tRNA ligase [Striga asiatica]
MPSANWRDVADNWFGNCCCSFGGVSEKLVAEYAKSYTCSPGLCLLTTTSVLLCKDDLLGCEFPNINPTQNTESDLNSPSDKVSPDGLKARAGCLVNHSDENGTPRDLADEDKRLLMNEKGDNCNSATCCSGGLGSSSELLTNETNVNLLENQKVFLDGYLGNDFMIKSSGLSKDINWVEFLCPQCSCLVGSYPCCDDGVPLDGGVRLFKCYISTCLPENVPNDVFRNHTLERMFACQLLESAEDELSFRTIIRDIQTKSPVLQIVLLNPNTWSCAGSLNPEKQASKLIMHPSIKVLFSASGHGVGFDSRILDDWARKNEADEIYMFSSQICELIQVLELAKSLSPPSCTSLQGLYFSSMRR